MKKLRRLVALIPAVALGCVLVSPVAAADQPGTQAGCGAGYTLTPLNDVLKIAAEGFRTAIRDADVNGDRQLCIKLIPNDGGPKQFDPAFLYVDNHV